MFSLSYQLFPICKPCKSKYLGTIEKNWSASEVQNSGSATVDNVLQYKPNADNGFTSNGTTSNVSRGKDTT
jgi:hypothetical protein